MAHEFRLPDIGEGLTEAEIVKWVAAVGERILADQVVVEVETAKAVVEIPSPYGGVVLQHGANEGETLAVGSVLVVIGEEGEAPASRPVASAVPEMPISFGVAAPIVGTISEEADDVTVRPVPVPGLAQPERRKALPLVRRMARQLGVDLSGVIGTGPNGTITRQDVEASVAGNSTVSVRAGERQPLSRLRRTIAANMERSWEIPHVTTFDEVDAGRLLTVRRALAERSGETIPIDALLVKAVVPALIEFPEFNATLDGHDLLLHPTCDIGVALDTPDGLLVGVIRDVGALRVSEIASEVVRLGAAAQERRLTPTELTGQTFTVSNIGAVGGGYGTPIIPIGTTAILSAGRAAERPVVRDGAVVPGWTMPLSLSYDHRVIDGALGRRFMQSVTEHIAEPALFLA